ncbi:MAG: thioredoxin family protein [Candidatus Gastranaerophilales bacterium]|nr:thioredoxin family protein [Candidatus Gastranaerophilales bacterium]
MKNNVIILLIFIVPVAVFALLQFIAGNYAANANSFDNTPNMAKLIKFYSPMCSECKEVSTNVKNALKSYEDLIIFEEIDVSDKKPKNQDMIEAYKITVVPTVIFIDKTGKIENKTEGVIDENEIKLHLENIK